MLKAAGGQLEQLKARAEYPLTDHQRALSARKVINFVVHVEVMPWVGVIRKYRLESVSYTVPPKQA